MAYYFTHPSSSVYLEPLVYALDQFDHHALEPIELVQRCAPLLSTLVLQDQKKTADFAKQLDWPSLDASSYCRQRLCQARDDSWSIYAITWLPGHRTPIHDHGTWGVVSVLQGALTENQMVRLDQSSSNEGIQLRQAGVCLLTPGAINSFLADPDHIHWTGVTPNAQPTASLHIYGRLMTQYFAYDLQTQTRTPLDVE